VQLLQSHREKRARQEASRRDYETRTYVGIPEGWGSALLVAAKMAKQNRAGMEGMTLTNGHGRKRCVHLFRRTRGQLAVQI
jgi:hypothetical protein